jgi:hypothetical protein
MSPNSNHPVNKFSEISFVARAILFAFLIAATALPARPQTQAQPQLETMPLRIGNKTIRAEIADEERERETGLMFRKSLAPDSGMLFIMPQTGPVAFWMRNTEILSPSPTSRQTAPSSSSTTSSHATKLQCQASSHKSPSRSKCHAAGSQKITSGPANPSKVYQNPVASSPRR